MFRFIVIISAIFVGCEDTTVYDIKAEKIEIIPPAPTVGEGVSFKYVVKNVGKNKIPQARYNIDLYLGGDKIAFDHYTKSIKPNDFVTYEMSEGLYHWTPTKSGVYKFKLVIDEKNELTELNKENNTITGQIIVKE